MKLFHDDFGGLYLPIAFSVYNSYYFLPCLIIETNLAINKKNTSWNVFWYMTQYEVRSPPWPNLQKFLMLRVSVFGESNKLRTCKYVVAHSGMLEMSRTGNYKL